MIDHSVFLPNEESTLNSVKAKMLTINTNVAKIVFQQAYQHLERFVFLIQEDLDFGLEILEKVRDKMQADVILRFIDELKSSENASLENFSEHIKNLNSLCKGTFDNESASATQASLQIAVTETMISTTISKLKKREKPES